jgi:hypothetical protein
VFIVVCNNTNVSKLVFDYIGGWAKPLDDGSTLAVPGQLDIFSNVEDGRWRSRPNTILIDSEQLESGEAMSDDSRRSPQSRSRNSSRTCGGAFRVATPPPSPMRTCCAK